MWALAGVRRLCWQGSPGLESSGKDLCPRSGPGSLLPYVLQSQVPRDWIGAGAVFHSPEVLGSRGESRVGLCGCWARLCWQGSPGLELSGRDLCPRSGPGSLLPYVPQSQVPRDWIGAGAVFHSPEVLGSSGESRVALAGVGQDSAGKEAPQAAFHGATVDQAGLELTDTLLPLSPEY